MNADLQDFKKNKKWFDPVNPENQRPKKTVRTQMNADLQDFKKHKKWFDPEDHGNLRPEELTL